MDCISEKKQRENLISQFKEFCECVYDEFGDDISCSELIASSLFENTFKEMYAIVDDCCPLGIKQKVASLVDTIQNEDRITFYELESELIEICNQLEEMSYRNSMVIDNGVYAETNFDLHDFYSDGTKMGSPKNEMKQPDEETKLDEKDREDVKSIIQFVKLGTITLDLSWFENDMLEDISSNAFALSSFNMNPYIKRQLCSEEVLAKRTFFAPFNVERCKNVLKKDNESFEFNDEEDLKDYTIVNFITIETKSGAIYNSMALLGLEDSIADRKQTVSGLFLYASEGSDEFLNDITTNISDFENLPEVDTTNMTSVQNDIDEMLSKQAFFKFYRAFLTKCDNELADELINKLDGVLENIEQCLKARAINAMAIVTKNLQDAFAGLTTNDNANDSEEEPVDEEGVDQRIERINSDKTFLLDIKAPKHMSFSTGEDGFVVYFNIDNKTNQEIDLTLKDIFIYANCRQWASDYNYTGYDFSHEIIGKYATRKVGKIWIDQNWEKGLTEFESYLSATFVDDNGKTYFFKYMYEGEVWSLYDYFEIED